MSKTSCFNPTVFRKNLTRFFPLWFLYTVLILVLVPGQVMLESTPFDAACQLLYPYSQLPYLFLGYGFLTALLLFSYLFRVPSANMFSSFPVTRHACFCTNILSGLLFFLVPHALAALLSMVLGGLAFNLAATWFLIVSLESLFTFAIGVLSIQCAGSFLGAGLFGLLFYLGGHGLEFARTAFAPLLYGTTGSYTSIAEELSPIAWMVDGRILSYLPSYYGQETHTLPFFSYLGIGWGWLAGLAALSALALLLSHLLYKARPMESAGDLVAFPWLRPVFRVAFTVLCTILFGNILMTFLFSDAINTSTWVRTPVPILVCYLSAGCVSFFAGEMLLEKTLRVFRRRNLLGCAGLAAALVLTVTAVHLDVFRISWKLPEFEEVQSVQISTGYRLDLSAPVYRAGASQQDDAAIQEVLDLHRLFLENREEIQNRIDNRSNYTTPAAAESYDYAKYLEAADQKAVLALPESLYDYSTVTIRYELKNGSTLTRSYALFTSTELEDLEDMGRRLNTLFNQEEQVLNRLFPSEGLPNYWDSLASQLHSADIWLHDTGTSRALTREEALTLVSAMRADMEAGTLGRTTAFYPQPGNESCVDWADISFNYRPEVTEDGADRTVEAKTYWKGMYNFNVSVSFQCENTIAALLALGITPPEI